jgi:hypothetical protein
MGRRVSRLMRSFTTQCGKYMKGGNTGRKFTVGARGEKLFQKC